MDYYDRKTKAFMLISDLISEGVDQEIIVFKVETAYGFPEKFTLERIESLNKITNKSNWKKEKKKREDKKAIAEVDAVFEKHKPEDCKKNEIK